MSDYLPSVSLASFNELQMGALNLSDLFAVGSGLDVAGAYLVARGLRRNPIEIYRRGTWGGGVEGQMIDEAHDRVWSDAGIPCLVTGFVFQAVGYALSNATEVDPRKSLTAGIVAFAIAVTVTVIVLSAERVTHRKRVIKLLIQISCVNSVEGPIGTSPNWTQLAKIAAWWQKPFVPRDDSEPDEQFARRVLEIER